MPRYIEALNFRGRRAWHTTLTETDLHEAVVNPGGRLAATIDANEIKTYRIDDMMIFEDGFETGDTSQW